MRPTHRAVRPLAAVFAAALLAGAAHAQCPSQPTILAASGSTCAAVVVWTTATNADDYVIYRSSTADFADAAQIGTSTVTNFTDGPATGGTYTYWVRGRRVDTGACPGGFGPLSPPRTFVRPGFPGPPTSFSATPGCGTVTLRWTPAPGSNVRITAHDAAGNEVYNAVPQFATMDYVYPGGPVPVSFTANTYTPCGEGGALTVAASPTLTTGGPPQSVSASDGECDNVVVSWVDSPTPATTRYLIRIASGGVAVQDVYLDAAVRSYTHTGAQPGKLYSYTVFGLTACYEGAGLADTGYRATPPAGPGPSVRAPRATTAVLVAPNPSDSPSVTYAWRRGANPDGTGGAPVTDGGRISGATTPRLTIAGVGPEDAEIYAVIATTCTGPAAPAPVALVVPTVCRPDYNGANGADLLDIFAFLSDWFAGCP